MYSVCSSLAIAVAVLAGYGKPMSKLDQVKALAATLPAAKNRARQAGLPLSEKDLPRREVPDSQNAAIALAKVFKTPEFQSAMGEASNDYSEVDRWNQDTKTVAEKEEVWNNLEKINEQLDAAVAATQLPYCEANTCDLLEWKYITDRLRSRGRLRGERGDFPGMLQDFQAVQKIVGFIHPRPSTINILVILGIEGMLNNAIYRTACNRPESASDLIRLFNDDFRIDFSKLLASDCASGAEEAITFYERVEKAKSDPDPENRPDQYLDDDIAAWVASEKLTRQEHIDAWLTAHYHYFSELASQISSETTNEQYTAVVNGMKGFDKGAYRHFWISQSDMSLVLPQRAARRAVVHALLVILNYKQLHGRYPGTLKEAGVKTLDPFTGEPLKLKLEGEGFVVYSLGQDLVDNGGTPPERFSTKGDIVARYLVK
jgi:hypothetical protein